MTTRTGAVGRVRRTGLRVRRTGLVWGAAVLAVTLTAGCANTGGTERDESAAGTTQTVEPESVATTTGPATPEPPAVAGLGAKPTPSATRAATPSKKPSQRPTPRKTPKPPTETQVPPPPKQPVDEACTKPRYEGGQASRAAVKQALANAAGRTYWPTSAPSIQIPVDLLKATAWQESGWQSNIIACDGGRGLMQVMPATATWMNQRFGQSYDIDAYQDNAYLGATYLAWTTKYIGDMYFDADYRLDADLCTSELNSCLLNAVIAAYNYGHAAVAVEGRPLTIPNPQYVRNVRALMTQCECLAF